MFFIKTQQNDVSKVLNRDLVHPVHDLNDTPFDHVTDDFVNLFIKQRRSKSIVEKQKLLILCIQT